MFALAEEKGSQLAVSDREAARRIGIGKTKLRELLKSGRIESARIGGRRVVIVASIERFLRESITP
jgi:excisionase family DNA binding protein